MLVQQIEEIYRNFTELQTLHTLSFNIFMIDRYFTKLFVRFCGQLYRLFRLVLLDLHKVRHSCKIIKDKRINEFRIISIPKD